MTTVYPLINSLLDYATASALIGDLDAIYMANRLCEFLKVPAIDLSDSRRAPYANIGDLLNQFSQWASRHQLIESANQPYADLFETALMDIVVPRPSDVVATFTSHYDVDVKQAMDWYYNFSKQTDYIKVNQIAKNVTWQQPSEYGEMVMTINLSKPEKDPKAIAAMANMPAVDYPKCKLCAENVGFAGRLDYPARQTHRIIPMRLADEDWFIQYSPYAYYNEHLIVVKAVHEPMLINRTTIERLVDFVDRIPHYFIGSNAGLPIVGGSMLAHDHYQAGHVIMPMALAKTYQRYHITAFSDVQVDWLHWPLTTLRLSSKNRQSLINCAEHLLTTWRGYSDPSAHIIAASDRPHNAITPIMRRVEGLYQLDMVLRNNLTTDDYPDGRYHPHPDVHPVKKENIGLIEVMGCAILPGRLKATLSDLAVGLRQKLAFDELPATCQGFEHIYTQLLTDDTNANLAAEERVKLALGRVFIKGLGDAGIMACNAIGEATMKRFIAAFNAAPRA